MDKILIKWACKVSKIWEMVVEDNLLPPENQETKVQMEITDN